MMNWIKDIELKDLLINFLKVKNKNKFMLKMN